MKRMTSALPTTNENTPLRIESCPSDGPEVPHHALRHPALPDARIGQHVPGHERAPLDQVARTAALLALAGHRLHVRPGVIERARLRSVCRQLELEERRAADQLLGAR